MTSSEQSSEATDPDKAGAASDKVATKATAKPAKNSAGENSTAVPTDGVPGFMRPVYNTGLGKRAFEIISDPALFLRYAVVGAAVLGLLFTLFSIIAVRGATLSGILTTLFYNLLVTLVATGVLYALREVVEQSRSKK